MNHFYGFNLYLEQVKQHWLIHHFHVSRSEEDAALLSNASLRDFQVICNLGEGETGHSELVSCFKFY